MTRTMWWVSGVLGALLVAVLITVGLLLATVNRQAEEQAYRDCMSSHGFAADSNPGGGTSLEEYGRGVIAASEACGK